MQQKCSLNLFVAEYTCFIYVTTFDLNVVCNIIRRIKSDNTYSVVVVVAVLNLIYFTTITKPVIQLILIMHGGTDVCVRMVFVWEKTGVPRLTAYVNLGKFIKR